jgi:hypothetical protein
MAATCSLAIEARICSMATREKTPSRGVRAMTACAVALTVTSYLEKKATTASPAIWVLTA